MKRHVLWICLAAVLVGCGSAEEPAKPAAPAEEVQTDAEQPLAGVTLTDASVKATIEMISYLVDEKRSMENISSFIGGHAKGAEISARMEAWAKSGGVKNDTFIQHYFKTIMAYGYIRAKKQSGAAMPMPGNLTADEIAIVTRHMPELQKVIEKAGKAD